jgi:hypothetical protein
MAVVDQCHTLAALPPRRTPVPILQEAPGPVWTGLAKIKSLDSTRIRTSDRPARNKLLYQLSHILLKFISNFLDKFVIILLLSIIKVFGLCPSSSVKRDKIWMQHFGDMFSLHPQVKGIGEAPTQFGLIGVAIHNFWSNSCQLVMYTWSLQSVKPTKYTKVYYNVQ